MTVDSQEFFAALDETVRKGWEEVHAGQFWQHMRANGIDLDLYRNFMVELYHYTRHNSINQAFAAWRVPPEKMGMLRFCYEHAEEELGHEKMVEHDLAAVGLLTPGLLERPPLPPTQALIGYLYHVGLEFGAIPRLGYSYWAESAYDHLGEALNAVRAGLGVSDREMSFFVAHQSIDTKHAQEVRQALERYATDPVDQARAIDVARTTLYLTGQLLEVSYAEYIKAPRLAAAGQVSN
ncbi:iron-containing redox enzyme family protein [Streptomyces sp. NBC_01190]|uniref:iron-containing redox enzyme family protein n=1 Tax=Streptomyces sp. NBC_01190 TaxID=2903767 RepID=UPI00386E8220|nr:iron-containing redox enzyme family protein [Streptomyces sp. NBC_01190]